MRLPDMASPSTILVMRPYVASSSRTPVTCSQGLKYSLAAFSASRFAFQRTCSYLRRSARLTVHQRTALASKTSDPSLVVGGVADQATARSDAKACAQGTAATLLRRYGSDMDHFTNPRVTRRILAASLVIVAALTLSACATSLTFSPLGTGEASVSVETSGGLLVIRVPASRPASGIEVQREDGRTLRIPSGHYPSPGECRIWIPDVAPGQQEPPGACNDLERQVPAGAYLVYG